MDIIKTGTIKKKKILLSNYDQMKAKYYVNKGRLNFIWISEENERVQVWVGEREEKNSKKMVFLSKVYIFKLSNNSQIRAESRLN
jgi:hypothetical protein